MSDLISRSKLIEDLRKDREAVCSHVFCHTDCQQEEELALDLEQFIENAPTVESPAWIPCSERLPEEHDSIFKKYKGTDKWDNAMFESISGEVIVTVEFEDGTRKTMTSYTTDGKWSCEKEYRIKMKVIAWCPLPEPYKGE